MDYSKKLCVELKALCKEKGIKGYSTKNKEGLIQLLTASSIELRNDIITQSLTESSILPEQETNTLQLIPPKEDKGSLKIKRLNYIGSKFQLLEWLTSSIQEKTGWTSLKNKRVADLFAGTGVVSYHLRTLGACVISNDAELFSSIITHAFTKSIYTEKCKNLLIELNTTPGILVGFITTHYSPHESSERMFFTVENAKRIDYLRQQLETLRSDITNDEYIFLLASLIISADAISNVPAVYGCYLKSFKAKAQKSLKLEPIHTMTASPHAGSNTFNLDVLSSELLGSFTADAVYLDPPYNERQYSKNYFPLNIIAKTPTDLLTEPSLKGKTGIPSECFLSPFCRSGAVEESFHKLFRELKTEWIFLSYNSESLVSKEKMLEIMRLYGKVSVIERCYKRFKSFEYNKDVEIKEYLFCFQRVASSLS